MIACSLAAMLTVHIQVLHKAVRFTSAHAYIGCVVSYDKPSKLQGESEADCIISMSAQAQPDLKIESPGLCRALFEVYTGSNSVVPDAKVTWAEGAKALLDSDEIRRSSRKSGG